MPYCRNCGKELPAGAAYCPNCGTPVTSVPPVAPARPVARPLLAGWGDRFIAWVVDIIIIGAIVTPLRFFVTWVLWPWEPLIPWYMRWIPFISDPSSIIHFIYWTFMEGFYGQSIGKMIIRIKVTRTSGKPVDIVYAAIESLGKAFLLPIDLIIGWILYPSKKQRLFSYISDTIVVKI